MGCGNSKKKAIKDDTPSKPEATKDVTPSKPEATKDDTSSKAESKTADHQGESPARSHHSQKNKNLQGEELAAARKQHKKEKKKPGSGVKHLVHVDPAAAEANLAAKNHQVILCPDDNRQAAKKMEMEFAEGDHVYVEMNNTKALGFAEVTGVSENIVDVQYDDPTKLCFKEPKGDVATGKWAKERLSLVRDDRTVYICSDGPWYNHLAKTQVCGKASDYVLEIGCVDLKTSGLLLRRSTKHRGLCVSKGAMKKFQDMDGDFQQHTSYQHLQNAVKESTDVTAVFIDGSWGPQKAKECLQLCLENMENLQLVVIKNKQLSKEVREEKAE